MAGPPSSAESTGELTLDQHLCLALYTASRAMTARYRVALEDMGLTYPQYLVMLLLWERETCSVSDIGRGLSLDSSTLSPLLKRLQAMDLVTRTRGTDDERRMLIGLTERGRALQAGSGPITTELRAATGMTLGEQLALVATLKELTTRLEESSRVASRAN